ncbi:MAG: M20 metallopeptidase family protein [Luteibaculaceae bacterium]
MHPPVVNKIKELASSYLAEIQSFREYLHQNPELSFQEFKTADFIEEKLKSFGLTNITRKAKTGVVVVIEGQNPAVKCVALRSDHDALPIQEISNKPYKSQVDNVMHACGHDVHTASLLGTAKILSQLTSSFQGSIKLIFQPGEEKLPGGASLLIKEGVLENPKVETILGQHVFPELPAGKVGFKPDMYMASCDELNLVIKGKGGHGAMPHKLIDPVVVAAQVILALQNVSSRYADPNIPTVLSIGKIIANGATNVIPNEVVLEGTFRTFSESWRTEAHQLIKQIAENTCKAFGADCIATINKGYPALFNHPETTQNAMNWAKEYLGNDNVVLLPLRPTGEDFSFYTQHAKGCFYRLGTNNEDNQYGASVHNPSFDIEPSSLKTGMGLMAYLALKQLEC